MKIEFKNNWHRSSNFMPYPENLAAYRPDFPEAFAALDEWQRDATARRGRWTLAQTPRAVHCQH